MDAIDRKGIIPFMICVSTQILELIQVPSKAQLIQPTRGTNMHALDERLPLEVGIYHP